MRAVLLILVMLAGSAAADQTVWKWVDKDGVTHYSDRPVPGATKMEISNSNRSQAPRGSAAPRPRAPSPPAGPPYRTLVISRPANGDSVVNTGGVVEVSIRVDPPIVQGHVLELQLDGQPVAGQAENSLQYTLRQVSRGTHTLVAVVYANGAQIQQTAPVAFHVRQESIAQPPVGPSVRPAPRPQRSSSNKLPTAQPSYATLNGSRPTIERATNAPKVTTPVTPATPKAGN